MQQFLIAHLQVDISEQIKRMDVLKKIGERSRRTLKFMTRYYRIDVIVLIIGRNEKFRGIVS